MYGVVLATMLAAGGSATPAWCHGCHGCHGCCYYSYGCHHGHHGCYYSSCCSYGCCSYGCYSYGCCYSCCSYGCYSCSVCSCYGCYGGCYYGSVVSAPAVYQVAATPMYQQVVPTYASVPTYATSPTYATYATTPSQPVQTATPMPKQEATSKVARVTVEVPANSRLWVDNVECPMNTPVRSFNTPPLNPNQQYFYDLKVELARDGRTVTESQRVLITPGQEARVNFTNFGALATASR